MGKIIGILSLKGGVGKTSITASLGDALSKFGKRVLLIDGNFSAPNLGVHFNVVEPEATLHDILARRRNVRDAIKHLDSFDLLPASIFYDREINVLDLKKKIGHLRRSYDFILIDSSPSLNEETLAVMLASDELLVVTTPDYMTLSSTIKSVKDAKNRGVNVTGIVLNKVYRKSFELSLDDIEKTLGLPVMAKIPHDKNVLKSVSQFVSIVSSKPRSSAATEISKLAATLSGNKHKEPKLKSLFKINPSRTDINRELIYERVFD